MTAPLSATGQYASAAPFFGSAASNLSGSPDDSIRIQAYELYENLYFNRPENLKLLLRGVDDEGTNPIYLPSARKCIEATNRFLAVEFDFAINPDRGEPAAQATMERLMGNLFKREKMSVKFANQKRFGLIRGDACWHITADDSKEEGKRISIHELNPSNYFPIEDPDNPDRLLGCHIVDVVPDPEDDKKTIARRLTYLRKGVVPRGGDQPGYMVPEGVDIGLAPITSETTHWAIGKWDDRNMKADDLEKVSHPSDRELVELPAQITSLPVYHWRNVTIPGETFGMSQISGIESLILAMNQSITDEDLYLVMQGLGMYWTDARPPVLPGTNTAGTWEIGPGVVVEVPEGHTFSRVDGVGNLDVFQNHIDSLGRHGMEGLGIPDIAAGKVDVTVAESGVSLALQLLPILASNAEKEEEILGTVDHMLYDISQQWLPAFESVTLPEVVVSAIVGDPVPKNRDSKIQEIILLFTSGLITVAMAQAELAKLGYDFMDGDDARVILEAQQRAKGQMGEMDNRYQQELEDRIRTLSDNAGKNVAPVVGAQAPSAPGTMSSTPSVDLGGGL